MQTKTTFRFLSASLLSIMLTACGGSGGNSAAQNTVNANKSDSSSSAFNGNTSNASNASTSSVDSTTLNNVGFGSGTSFVAGKIGVGIGTDTLAAGGVTSLTVNMVSQTGTLVTQNVSVTFNSKCVASGESKLSATSVATANGEASTTYTASGCVGDDLVTASVNYNGTIYTAQTTLKIDADTVQTIKFVDATPTLINLKGTGGNETSVVRFQVVGMTGAPVKNIDVSFALSTKVGGLALTTDTVTTDSKGYASTTVQAGTIATSVRVTATDGNVLHATQSNQLLVSTGIPDQKSMSLATSLFTPAAWNYDGVETTYTVFLADAFNNFAPDDTTVSFTTEGGAIDSGCNTKAGKCSVKWRSQEPRPQRAEADESTERKLCRTLIPGETMAQCEAKRAGRITVLATAIGNESFIDGNGDGYFDPANPKDLFNTVAQGGNCTPNEPVSTANVPVGSPTKPCDDLAEAYLDKDESGTHATEDNFVDFNSDSLYSAADGLYNGALCKTPGNGCTRDKVTIRRQGIMTMSCDHPLLNDAGTALPDQPTNLSMGLDESGSVTIILADCNGNGLPAGTTVTLGTDTATNVTFSNSQTGALPDSINYTTFTLFYKSNKTDPASGAVIIKVNVPVPGGAIKTTSVAAGIN